MLHVILEFGGAEFHPAPQVCIVRGGGHILETTREDQLIVAGLDGLRSEHDRLKP